MTEMYQSGELKKLLGLWSARFSLPIQKLIQWAWSKLD
jgi:hypothetical protein